MTSRIRVLPPQLANQIAAGEVVERPASVVKELCENAVDAGARRIEVELDGGGRGSIRVVDDGHGMPPDDLALALTRHATSKLTSPEQLFELRTLGFRGEALPSIASVSRLTLISREAQSHSAFRMRAEGGQVVDMGLAGAPVGTQVLVEELFFNVPARLKFLKAEATESGHVLDTLVRLALAHPEVHVRLRAGGRTQLDLPPHPSMAERARAAIGRRGAVALHEARGEAGGVIVEACLAAPSESGSTSRGSYLFVNGRPVRDRGLLAALSLGYGEAIERGRYPLAVVAVIVPPADVDVNVHPQKLEVRFARPHEVAQAVRQTVALGCARAPWRDADGGGLRVYALPPERAQRLTDGAGFEEQRSRLADALALFAPRGGAPVPGGDGFFRSLRYLGQLHRTYLVCEAEGELVLIDQHAAHERVAFEKLRVAHAARAVATQRLLFPHTLDLDRERAEIARAHEATLRTLGFDLEPFGGASFAVKAVPESLASAPLGELLGELLDQLARGDAGQVAEELLATMACHSVVRAGDLLDDARARALLDALDGVDFRAHAPHGRPALLRMALGEIERRFGR